MRSLTYFICGRKLFLLHVQAFFLYLLCMTSLKNLPIGDSPAPLPLPHFPTSFQAFIWRNWGRVPLTRLAKVLFTSEENVRESAKDLGLPLDVKIQPEWLAEGYLTLIRQNWHILPYEQLLVLLNWTPEKLLAVLHEEDFLWIKMGSSKPNCHIIKWRELTAEEENATDKLCDISQKYFSSISDITNAELPFDFAGKLAELPKIVERTAEPANAGEITFDGSWCFQWETSTPLLEQWADDFALRMKQQWNVHLSLENSTDKKVLLRIAPDDTAPRESHRVDLQESQIIIEGVDERGVLRGLQWLERTFIARGGPHFKPKNVNRRTRFEQRIIHPYNASYGETLAQPNHCIISDGLLARLADCGVNGLWMQGILYQLQPWPKIDELNQHWETRIENLRRLSERAARYGIGIYLYLNEPRALPLEIWEAHPEIAHWRGVTAASAGTASLCTSIPEVRDGLRQALANLFSSVPELAGCFTISMSENLTHCYSKHNGQDCPRCSKRAIEDVLAQTNATIAEGVWQGNPRAEVINWTWAWGYGDPESNAPENWAPKAMEKLPNAIKIMCTSEEALPTHVGGVEGSVVDYTISQVGPSPRSKAMWRIARETGHKNVAKVQFNNTWENSAVPYLPVLQLIEQHLGGLCESGVGGLLLSWTLGGYPSPNLKLASTTFWEDEKSTFADDNWWQAQFGENAKNVSEACEKFSAAFREFPFHISGAYTAPYNYGPMNLLHAKSTGRRATMLGFPYDGLDQWRSIYPEDIYENQLRLVESGWQEGLQLLDHLQNANDAIQDLRRVAHAAWIHFRSTTNQVSFIRRRDVFHQTQGTGKENLRRELLDLLNDEISLAQQMARLQREDSRLGYEASNHYYYAANELGEKVLNCERLKEYFEER